MSDKKMSLSLVDGGTIQLIKSITKQTVIVEKENDHFVMRWFQSDPVKADVNERSRIVALKDAIRGRLGDRFISQHWEKDEYILRLLPDMENPVKGFEHYDEQSKDYTIGDLYERKVMEVRAMQVRKDNAEELAKFTGGGTLSETERVVYSFISDNGLYMDAPEGTFIVHDGNNYAVYSPQMFNYTFARK